MRHDQLPRDEYRVRTVDQGDGVEYVVDLGSADTDAAVDVVDGTAIVVADGAQYDVDLPRDDAKAFIRNGVLTITTEDSL
ncbi:hypothetical protein BRC81_08320 [Halobacteriales archaeon QS_1_68_20]|nr:MAG: hypothetical protein BRC81_08320 [Halobacteriales archaeon QS_1_68_20]